MDVLIQDIRCFAGLHKIPVRPLTILIGENSTGKSTFLALLSAVSNSTSFPFRPGFNDPPYSLGTYETIARWGASPRDRSASFALGLTRDGDPSEHFEAIATYVREKGQPVVSKFRLTRPNVRIEMAKIKGTVTGDLFLAAKNNRPEYRTSFEVPLLPEQALELSNFLFLVVAQVHRKKLEELLEEPQKTLQFETMLEFVQASRFGGKPCQSIAPIRTKPRRTYDQVREVYTPEGDHVPLILASSLPLASENKEFAQLKQTIENFGKESGMFSQVSVRPLGRTTAGPFQLLIKGRGGKFNLSDVGYGVSQVLPVVVQSVLAKNESRLLLQQPEVHLHPKAQAALGSFFVRLVKDLNAEFVIETHSDYLIDRVRREVAEGRIASSDVLLLYFSKKQSRTKLYPIEIDSLGNVQRAPRDYRRFFLEEETRLLMRSGQ